MNREEIVEALAIGLLAAEECDFSRDETVEGWIPHYQKMMAEYKGSEHCGSCTNVPATCMRCVCDAALAKARDVLPLVLPFIQAETEAAWRDGFQSARGCLTDDAAFCLTDDVEQDCWLDSKTAIRSRTMEVDR